MNKLFFGNKLIDVLLLLLININIFFLSSHFYMRFTLIKLEFNVIYSSS